MSLQIKERLALLVITVLFGACSDDARGSRECYSPGDNRELGYEDGTQGCPCSEGDARRCDDDVAFTCENGRWHAAIDDRCESPAEACYAPGQHLDSAYEPGALGCACGEGDVDLCIQGVALVCESGFWAAVYDGPCQPLAPSCESGYQDDGSGACAVVVAAAEAPLVRRAALLAVETLARVESEDEPPLSAACAQGQLVAGQLDTSSHYLSFGSYGFLVDAYVVTATSTGTVSVASSVQPIGAAYRYGYGFPLNAQAVDASGALPSLSASLISGMALPDDALDDGKARMDLEVQAGTQYVVLFKALVGPASRGEGFRYKLAFCEGLTLEGKLWVSGDEHDLVPAAPLSGLISRDNASPGAMGQVASAIVVQ